jgi:hypothetical protein
MANPTENEERIASVNREIARDSITVSFERTAATSDSYGGYDYSVSSVSSQTFRMIRRPTPVEVLTTGGRAVMSPALLLCSYNADIQRGDRFSDSDGNTFEVLGVHTYDYKVEADLQIVETVD